METPGVQARNRRPRGPLVFSYLLLGFIVYSCSHGESTVSAPQVISTAPSNHETNVALERSIAATFSEPIDVLTLTPETFLLNRRSGRAPGTFQVTDNLATFVPSADLSVATRYTATLTTGVKSTLGKALPSDYTWSFTTRDGAWSTGQRIETDDAGDAWSPDVAMDSDGNALAVWYQSDGRRFNAWANRYTPESGWGVPALLETGDLDAHGLQVVMNGNGEGWAVWLQSNGGPDHVWANHYVKGIGWTGAQIIQTDPSQHGLSPDIALNSRGSVIAVWIQFDGIHFNTYANHYLPETGWGIAEPLQIDSTQDSGTPRVILDENGNALALWTQKNSQLQLIVWSNQYAQETGWGTPQPLHTGTTADAYLPEIAMGGDGSAFAVWLGFHDASVRDIWMSQYVIGTGWKSPELFDSNGIASYPRVAMNPSGHAMISWGRWNGNGYSLFAKEYDPLSGWGAVQSIQIDGSSDISSHQIVMDAEGNALAVWKFWQQSDPFYRIYSSRYLAGVGWLQSEPIEMEPQNALFPQITMNADGKAVAVWQQIHDASPSDIMANYFH